MSELSKWKSHKIVNAGKITYFDPAGRSDGLENSVLVRLLDVDGKETAMDVSVDVFRRNSPSIGDYLVIYPDGYISWSPSAVFEDGYSLVLS